MATGLHLISIIYFSSITCVLSSIAFDVSEEVSLSELSCLISNYSVEHIISNAWNNSVFVNSSVTNLHNMRSFGLDRNDVYMIPCVGINATLQMETLLDLLIQNHAIYDAVWIYVTMNADQACDWSHFNGQENCNFIMELGQYAQSRNRPIGIFSTKKDWKLYIGDGYNVSACPEASQYSLWYGDNDHEANNKDWEFNKFGGWQVAALKQYWTNFESKCGVTVDLDYTIL